MKKVYTTSFLLFLFLVGNSFAGTWKFGGKVSMEQGDDRPDLVTAITAEYQIISMLSWRTDLEAIFRDMGNKTDFDISLPTNLLWYPFRHENLLEPFIGPGLVYTFALPNTQSFGINVLGGVNINLKDKPTFGLEVKYTVTDVVRWSASDKVSVSLTGSWKVDF